MDSPDIRQFCIDTLFSSRTNKDEKYQQFLQRMPRPSAKSSAERMREYRQRKKVSTAALTSAKSNAERCREYRERKKHRTMSTTVRDSDSSDVEVEPILEPTHIPRKRKPRKTQAEVAKEYRLRKKLRANLESAVDAQVGSLLEGNAAFMPYASGYLTFERHQHER